jgi:general secretion pathway protein B
MSYILDALKRAESERQLGSVPNVYREPLPIAKSEAVLPLWRQPGSWIATGLLVAAAIAGVWTQTSQHEAPRAAPDAAQKITSQNPVPEAVAQAPLAAHDAKGAIRPPVKKKEAGEEVRAVKKVMAAAPKEKRTAPEKPLVTAAKVPPAKSAVNPEPAQRSTAQEKAPNAALVQPQNVVTEAVLLRDLPEHIRRGIPSISVGGYIYSPNPAARSMLLNNRLVREGDQLASGLTLERMMLKEAVLNYQGQRFRLPY